MRLSYAICHALIQGTLAESFLILWQIYEFQSIPEALGSSSVMFFFIGLYELVFGIILLKRGTWERLIIVSLLASLFTTFTFVIYPQLGFAEVAWWIIFLILVFAAILGHGFLRGAGARMNSGDM